MNTNDPITDLMNDHRLIESVIAALERKLSSGGEFPSDFVAEALSFFVEYADHFHHFKEEDTLFPALAAQGMSTESGPIGIMLHEHTLGRKILAGIREGLDAARGGDARAQASIRAYAQQYAELLRGHIWKEDNVLFNMARRALDEAGLERLLARYAEGCHAKVAAETVEKHRQFAARVAG